ncbi:MAG: hypothetical protein AAF843_19195 [Bacteroidota bacterium]
MEGNIPNSVLDLESLATLSLSNNNYKSLLNFKSHSNASNLSINISSNLLDFGSIESNLNADGTIPFVSFTYSPQNSPDSAVQNHVFLNESADVQNLRAGGVNTLYQWEEWNGTNWVNVDGQNSADLNLPMITLDDDGRRFRCEMTNTLITDMTLYSEEYVIQVIIPQTFYAISDGNWSDPTIWSLTDGGTTVGQVPTQFDDVEIGAFQVEVTEVVDCRGMNISAANNTLLLVSGREAKLTVNGEVTILNQGAVENKIVQVTNGGTLECK